MSITPANKISSKVSITNSVREDNFLINVKFHSLKDYTGGDAYEKSHSNNDIAPGV